MGHRRDLLGGTVLLLIGVILLLRNLGYVPLELDRWWPVILIVIGLGIVLGRQGPASAPQAGRAFGERRRRTPVGGLVLIGLGIALLAGRSLGPQNTGALILIALGLAFVVSRLW